jgi:hypothetical protein
MEKGVITTMTRMDCVLKDFDKKGEVIEVTKEMWALNQATILYWKLSKKIHGAR